MPDRFAIVLAAGAATRMGHCKTTLPWLRGKPLLQYQVEQWLQAGVKPIVVLSPHNEARATLPPGVQTVINPDPHRGKTSSILCGLEAVPVDFSGLAIAAVDQPRPAWIYQTLWAAHQASPGPITAPMSAGKLGHPLIFAPELRSELAQLDEASLGLRAVVQRFADQIQRVEFTTAIVHIDLNTPAHYQTQLALAMQSPEESGWRDPR
jgi:molybdenum cofactor cytidylyltransferase